MEREMSNDLAEQLEMVTLDKLVAEERAENMQIEIDDQKHKILELESEVALLKNSTRNASMLDTSDTQQVIILCTFQV
jgi:hypothetical protein